MPVEDPHRLPAGVDDGAELLVQAGVAQGDLAVLLVDVQHAALGTGGGRFIEFVDRGGDAVDVQRSGERQAAEAAADDGDVGCVHGMPPC